PAYLGAGPKRYRPVRVITDDRHAESPCERIDVDRAVRACRALGQRDAELALARALGRDRPTGAVRECAGVNGALLGQDHDVTIASPRARGWGVSVHLI